MTFNPAFIFLLFFQISASYYSGIFFSKYKGNFRKTLLTILLLINISPLLVFKYSNFFIININYSAALIGWNYSINALKILLPIGISFYVFKSVSYIIDVYRDTIPVERRFDVYALYISFFPELLAGPIDRAKNLITQIKEIPKPSYDLITQGIRLIIWGLIQKVVIADRLALFVNPVFDNPGNFGSLTLIIASIFFSFQIYCDFSGYSDIAIGTGLLFGFKLMNNFDSPYISKSVSEFWRRWHISLSTWFRDYLFLPIAYKVLRVIKKPKLLGIKNEIWSYTIATIATMLVAGLWHGASWTFIMWGLLIGLYITISFGSKKLRKKINNITGLNKKPVFHNYIKIFISYSLITYAWIFFRANSLSDSFLITKKIFTGISFDTSISQIIASTGFNINNFIISILGIITIMIYQFKKQELKIKLGSLSIPYSLKFVFYTIVAIVIFLLGIFNSKQFIYTKF
jgi:D-alanyl-lipoteichoic acid acyltransferase DltB (MBOAT superfamily)